MLTSLLGAISQGILWGIMVLGVYITYKLLDIADLTVDGSFATGGAVCAVAIVAGVDPALAIVLGMLAGGVCGLVTGLLTTVLKIPAILSGILTQISLWSVNLRIMGKSNTPLLQNETIFTRITALTGLGTNEVSIICGLVVAVLCIAALYWFFGTELGCALRATGNNEHMIRALGVNTDTTKVIALTLSNALVGLSGALICESQKYADVGMGTGAIVIGLAAIVIGEVLGRLLPGKLSGFMSRLMSALVGSIVYFLIRAIVLQLGMDANDMKLLSAIIVALALCVPVISERIKQDRAYKAGGEH